MAQKRTRQAFEADLQRHESPFVTYGTPLPPLDSHARDDGSYVPAWKQEVTDAQGRKRLHGAFTGGFSAGYYNTVGSKEGWTPATFLSSRSNRIKDNKNISQQKPEDFMDDEDIREAEESKILSTNNGFSGFGTADDPSRSNAMIDLFRPAEDSMGVKLLNKMGWKQGQGIGPRVKRKIDTDDPLSDVHLFAPEDVPMISFVKKNDFKGLGYSGEAGLSKPEAPLVSRSAVHRVLHDSEEEEEGRPGLSFANRAKKSRKTQKGGMGVGILNDTGSDDEDPYAMGPRILYNKTLGGDKKAKKKAVSSVGMANPLLTKKPVYVSKKLSLMQNVLRKCHDGRLPLAGFVLADELDAFSLISLSDDKYKPPQVPEGWKPAKAHNTSASLQSTDYQPSSTVAKNSGHTHTTRASALGETLLPGKSVFDFLSHSARERLVRATGKTNLPQAHGEALTGTSQSGTTKLQPDLIPYLDPQTASQALARATIGGFMPYAEDLPKRQRYQTFLEISAGTRDGLPTHPPGTNTEDYMNELNEFVRAAEVFRPVSDGLGSRFTSSSSSIVQTQSQSQSDANPDPNKTENLISRPPAKAEDPAEVAAKVGMFGPLTRTVLTFAPTRLVAKRFGVEYIGAAGSSASYSTTATATPAQQSTHSVNSPHQSTDHFRSGNANATGERTTLDENLQAQTQTSTSADATQMLSEDVDALISSLGGSAAATVSEGKVDVDTERNEALERERPGQAVFRAIFGSDDDDDDGDEE